MSSDGPEPFDQVAREVLEKALGATFEDDDAVPRRESFLRDATDVLSQFVAARTGNPGFHSARFFDAVVALAAARDRIKEAARRSRVVERLIEAERKLTVLEQRLRDRDEQMTALAKGDAAPVARALAAAEARLASLEEELAETRHLLAEKQADRPQGPRDGHVDPPDSGLFPVARAVALPGEPTPPRVESEPELAALERDALRAQLEQIVEREKAVRAERNALKAERDELKAERDGLAARATAAPPDDRLRALERERDEAASARSLVEAAKRTLDQELSVAKAEILSLKQIVAGREQGRDRSTERLEDSLARARSLESSLHRETQDGSRARRERDDLRLERDRLRAAVQELAAVRDAHRELLSALGVPSDLTPDRALDELARRREVVLVHEPPAWDSAVRGLERVRDRAPSTASAEARARLARQASLRARYEVLRGGRGVAQEMLELQRVLAQHEEDLRWAEAIEAVLDETAA